MVQFQWCKLFKDTISKKAKQNPDVLKLFKEFIQLKSENPNQSFGSRDGPFKATGTFTKYVPKLRHAHLMHDLNICYTINGKDPTTIKLYGVFKHDELGTGQPANINRQQSVASKMGNQSFDPMPNASSEPQTKKSDDYKNAAWYKSQYK